MRAVWYDRTGPAREVFVHGELETPSPARGEVLIRLHASGVNPSDTRFRGGGYGPMAYPRIIPNSDGAGVVLEAGPGAPADLVGKRVWFYGGQRNGRAFGTAAEHISLDHTLVRVLPDHIDFAEGATFGIPGMTGHTCLFAGGPVQGKIVLVTGGAGACGLYAVALARWAGATVIATVSSDEKGARATAGGAHHIVNYRSEDVTRRLKDLTGGAGVDHVVEVDLGANLPIVLPAMRNNGSIAYYAVGNDPNPRIPATELVGRNIAVHAIALPRYRLEARVRAQDDIAAWAAATPARVDPVDARFPLADTAQAHERVESGTKNGTVIVEM